MIGFMSSEYGLSLEQMMDVPLAFMVNRMIDRGKAQQKAEEVKNRLATMELDKLRKG